MKGFLLSTLLLSFLAVAPVAAQEGTQRAGEKASRLTIGGYGEAVFTRNFYSDKYLRYTDAQRYKDDDSHGRFDLPHVVLWLGYDFGHGWSLGTEIEFEHGGTESAVEIEEEEAGEYEAEVERGGEVALEQFWINKEWLGGRVNLKMGHLVVPVGATNMYHLPTEFFTNYRPEGESTIMPCTWHETGVSLWGEIGKWRYEVMMLPGLDSDRFGRQNWIAGGAGSPYEFKIANSYAGAFRVDNFSVKGLRLSLSGYIGNSFKNTLSVTENAKYKDVKGTVMIGAFDFCYETKNFVVRGNFDYGHLSDSELITKYNMSMRNDSPSPKQAVGSDAIAVGVEAGYDIFSLANSKKMNGKKLHLFGRYEYYDSMFKTEGSIMDAEWCGRQRVAVGVNYRPLKSIVLKGEYSIGLLGKAYNNEPAISFGIAYFSLFK
ncbi:MAG: hypothetical protein IJF46_03700 [Bacteroidaceae bacterium]|nr:hypothetical protein [Bacteroidaceae bacterium]